MTQNNSTLTTPPQKSTCATCPKFKDYQGRERGLCQVFDRVVRKHHQLTNDCQRVIAAEQLKKITR